MEAGAGKLLKKKFKKNKIFTKQKLDDLINSKYIIVCIGTPWIEL